LDPAARAVQLLVAVFFRAVENLVGRVPVSEWLHHSIVVVAEQTSVSPGAFSELASLEEHSVAASSVLLLAAVSVSP
jgi:hypothetical protein